MKKVIIGLALCAYSVSEGMLVPFSGSQVARRDESYALSKAGESEDALSLTKKVNFRTLQPSLLLSENAVSVLIKEYSRVDDVMTQIGGAIEKQYPLQRELLRYEHDLSQGYSYPIQKLFVHIDDIEFADQMGDIVLDEEYIGSGIRHQKRATNRYEMDDEHLLAKQLSEIFITTEIGDQVIDEAKVRAEDAPISYVRTTTPATVKNIGTPESRVGDDEFAYQKTETSEEYIRPDGTPFVKKTEDWQKVAKPKPPAPVPPKPATKTIPIMAHQKGGTWYHHYTNHWQAGVQVVDINDPRDHIDIWP